MSFTGYNEITCNSHKAVENDFYFFNYSLFRLHRNSAVELAVLTGVLSMH